MRIVCISDTHGLHREVEVPYGDLLIHAGDITFSQGRGPLAVLRDFDEWLAGVPCRHRVVIPGNHDAALVELKSRKLIKNGTLLVNSGVAIEGVYIWGSPVTSLSGEPFGIPDVELRKRLWATIPKNTDVLITHGPALGLLDQEVESDLHQGCPELRDAILRVRPRLHVCGHVHGGYGRVSTAHTTHINAALFDELGGVERRPIVIRDSTSLMRERSR